MFRQNTIRSAGRPIFGKAGRVAAVAIGVLFVGLSVLGIFGVWWVEHRASGMVRNGFGVVETGVGVVETGVGRVEDLIATGRMEVRQAAETITTVGVQAEANGPVLDALNERLEARLAPRIAQMQQVLAPVRDAVGMISHAVSLVNALPMMAERAPRLAALDETFTQLEGLSADTTQLRGTLRALVLGQRSGLTAETVATLTGLTQRIDTRLGEVQANVQGVQEEIAALQLRMATRKARVLFLFNLLALVSMLLLAWMLYSQVVVIRHHRAHFRRPAVEPSSGEER